MFNRFMSDLSLGELSAQAVVIELVVACLLLLMCVHWLTQKGEWGLTKLLPLLNEQSWIGYAVPVVLLVGGGLMVGCGGRHEWSPRDRAVVVLLESSSSAMQREAAKEIIKIEDAKPSTSTSPPQPLTSTYQSALYSGGIAAIIVGTILGVRKIICEVSTWNSN